MAGSTPIHSWADAPPKPRSDPFMNVVVSAYVCKPGGTSEPGQAGGATPPKGDVVDAEFEDLGEKK